MPQTEPSLPDAPRKILLCPGGTRGDVQPVVALALRLKSAGHQVLFATAPNYGDWIERLGLRFHPMGSDVQAFMIAESRGADGRPIATVRTFGRLLRSLVDEQLGSLMALGGDFDLMIGASVQLAAPAVAEHFGIPYRWVGFCPPAFPSADHPPFSFPHRRLPRFFNRLLWAIQSNVSNWTILGGVNRRRARLGLEPARSLQDYLVGHRPLLAAAPELAPAPPDVAAQVVQTGFWSYEEPGARLPDAVERFLAAGAKPVYIGFGSMGDPKPQRSAALLREALRETGLRAIVYRGWADLGAGLENENLLVTGDTPHPLLFPRCAAAVHHGGAGTSHTAARAGVPQVVVPHLLDQYYWGHRLWELGLAPKPLPKSRLTAQNFAAALRQATRDSGTATRAAEMGARLRRVDGIEIAMKELLSP